MATPGSFVAGSPLTAAEMNLLPAGRLASATITAAQGSIVGTDVDITGLTITFTAITGRRYRISANGLMRSTVANDVGQMQIMPGVSGGGTGVGLSQAVLGNTSFAVTLYAVAYVTGSGSVSYHVRCLRSAGTGTLTFDAGAVYPAHIVAEDIGT